MQAVPWFKQMLSFWGIKTAADLLPDVVKTPHAEDDFTSSNAISGSSFDAREWASCLWELAGSEQDVTAVMTAHSKVGPTEASACWIIFLKSVVQPTCNFR